MRPAAAAVRAAIEQSRSERTISRWECWRSRSKCFQQCNRRTPSGSWSRPGGRRQEMNRDQFPKAAAFSRCSFCVHTKEGAWFTESQSFEHKGQPTAAHSHHIKYPQGFKYLLTLEPFLLLLKPSKLPIVCHLTAGKFEIAPCCERHCSRAARGDDISREHGACARWPLLPCRAVPEAHAGNSVAHTTRALSIVNAQNGGTPASAAGSEQTTTRPRRGWDI